MRNDTPPKNTICQVRGCKSAAETYVAFQDFKKLALCGLHVALYRAWRDKIKDD